VNKELIKLLIWFVPLAVVFALLWRGGYLLRFSNYVAETREELKKCTWPTWAELKGSTFVVMISILLLGAFTVLVDVVFHYVVNAIT
jgi:preprotein translocase subunit SecE